MAIIEPGIYRIVNVGRKMILTVPAGSTSTIVGLEKPFQSGQQWFIRRSGGSYHILDCALGQYIMVDSLEWGARACLGTNPAPWEIIPAKDATYTIKLVGHNLVLDSYGVEDGGAIHVWEENSDYPQRSWRLERLGSLPSDEPEPVRFGATERTHMLEQLAQKDKQIVELADRLTALAGQLADQNQKIADQNQIIRDILKLKKESRGYLSPWTLFLSVWLVVGAFWLFLSL